MLKAKGGTPGVPGQYFTPRPLTPIPREFDWQSLLKRDGDELGTHYRHVLESFELVDGVARLCCMNMLLHGIGDSGSGVPPLSSGPDSEQRRDASAALGLEVPIEVRDALGGHGGKYYDMVMTNPPFGKKSSVTIRSFTRAPLRKGDVRSLPPGSPSGFR